MLLAASGVLVTVNRSTKLKSFLLYKHTHNGLRFWMEEYLSYILLVIDLIGLQIVVIFLLC
jgi:hypothetical protein